MPCLILAYTRKPSSSGYMIRVASSLFTPTLATGVCHHCCRTAATTWCRRQCRCPSCGFSEPRRKPARRQRAPIPSPAPPSLRLFVLLPPFFLFSFALGSLLYQKKPAKYASFKFCSKIDFSLRVQSPIFCAFFLPFFSFLGSSASPMFISAGAINLISRRVHLATVTCKSPSLSSASEHYVGV